MAEETLGRLKIALNMDGAQLEQSLNSAKRSLNIAQESFRATGASVSKFGDTMDTLKEKAGSLENVLEKQKVVTAKLDQEWNNAKASASKMQTELKNLNTEHQNAVKVYGAESQEAAALQAKIDAATKEYNKNAKAASALEMQYYKSITAMQKTQTSISDTATSLENLKKKEEEAGNATGGAGAKLAAFGAKGVSVAAGMVKAFAGVTVAIAGAGAAAAASAGNEMDKGMGKIQAMTGKTASEMAGMKKQIQEVYTNGWGESIDDVSASMGELERNIGKNMKGVEGQTTQAALIFKESLGVETLETGRAAKSMMDNFDFKNPVKAMDIMMGVAQRTKGDVGEIVDSFNEYSVQAAKLGYNAEEFGTALVNANAVGGWSIDKLGDAMKEFSIRSIDGSKTTAAGFKGIGLNADEMAKKFGAGGDTAKKAFHETVEAIKKIKDPVEQNAAGVALFGTQWEDLGVKAISALDVSGQKTLDFSGTTKEAGDALSDNLGSKIESIKRQFMTGFASDSNPLYKMLKNIASWVSDHMPQIQATIGATVGAITTKFSEFTGGTGSAWEKIKGLGSYLVDVFAPLFEAFKNNWNEFMTFLSDTGTLDALKLAWDNIQIGFQWFIDNIPVMTENIGWFIDKFDWLLAGIAGGAAAWGAYTLAMTAWQTATKIGTAIQLAFNGAMLASPLTWIVVGIGAVIAIGVLLYKNWDKIKAKGVELWNKTKEVASGIWNSFTGSLGKLGGWFSGIWDGIVKGVTGFISDIGSGIGDVIDAIKSPLENLDLFDTGVNILKGLWSGISDTKDWLMDKIKGLGKSIKNWAKDALGIHSPSRVMANEVGKYIPMGIAVGIQKNMNPLKKTISAMATQMIPDVNPFIPGSAVAGAAGVNNTTNISPSFVINSNDPFKTALENQRMIRRMQFTQGGKF